MKLARVKNDFGRVDVTEVTNRYGVKEYLVDYTIKHEGYKSYTYKTIESAMKKYNKVTKILADKYMEMC